MDVSHLEHAQQIEALFDALVELDPAARAAYLDAHAPPDESVRQEVVSLLAAFDADVPALDAALGKLPDVLPVLAASSVPEPPSAPASEPGFSAGYAVGPYEILEKIGAGGMGVVYKARDTRLGRVVALKFLTGAAHATPEAQARFEHEARAASALDHENIGTLYDLGEDAAGQRYLAMAYYDGETLRARLQRGALPPEEALALARQAAAGLEAAHAADILHRDVKPANLIITERGQLKIVDFGLAKMADVSLTRTGTTLGTVAYMSPEQVQGEPVDARTDVWSLGVVLHEMLSGRPPFEGDYVAARLYALLHDAPPPLTEAPPALARIVARCLEKDPAARYPSMAALRADLEAVEAGTAPLLPAAPSGAPAPSPRRAWILGGVVAGLLVLLALSPLRRTALEALGLAGLPAQKHVAVLPFSLGEDDASASARAFVEGLTETLTRTLASAEAGEEDFWMVPAAVVQQRAVTEASAAHAALGASLVLAGGFESRGDNVRLALELIDAETLRPLKTATVEGRQDEPARFQEALARKAAALLEIDLPASARRVLADAAVAAPGAHEFYLQGRGYLQRYDQPEQLDLAIQLFEQALAADPSYALAHAGLGEAYLHRYDATLDPQWAARAEEHSERAVEALSEPGPVYVTLGSIHRKTGRNGSARAFFELAIARDSTNTEAWSELGSAYRALGQFGEAEAAFKQAIALKPSYWGGYKNLGLFYLRMARHEEALEQFQQILRLTPNNRQAYNNLGVVYYQLQQFEEAAAAWEQALALEPSYQVYSNLATVYYFEFKDYERAARMYEQALALQDSDYRLWGYLGAAYYWSERERPRATEAWERYRDKAEALLAVNPRDAEVLAGRASAAVFLGETEDARHYLDRAIAEQPTAISPLTLIGAAYEILGERRQALVWLQRALERGLEPRILENNPWLQALCADPRYEAMRSSQSDNPR